MLSTYAKVAIKAIGVFSARAVPIGSYKLKGMDDNEDSSPWKVLTVQSGVVRTNCVDCLDRTNVGQHANGMVALGIQFQVLGLSHSGEIEPESAFSNILNELYEVLGDTVAIQYGGSVAHKKYGQQAHDAVSNSAFRKI